MVEVVTEMELLEMFGIGNLWKKPEKVEEVLFITVEGRMPINWDRNDEIDLYVQIDNLGYGNCNTRVLPEDDTPYFA